MPNESQIIHVSCKVPGLNFNVRAEYIEELKVPIVMIAQPIFAKDEIVTMADTKHAWVKIPLASFKEFQQALNMAAAEAMRLSGPVGIWTPQ